MANSIAVKYIECDQGEAEWHEARAGVITASMARVIRKTLASGDYNSAAKKYAFRLAMERITGFPLDDTYKTSYMRRGNDQEPFARRLHSDKIDLFIIPVGFIVTMCGSFGASSDGFIDDDGCAEYKCYTAADSLIPIIIEDDLTEVMDQIQMNLWLNGRDWCDFCVYLPQAAGTELVFTMIKVPRDEAYIAAMVRDLYAFDALVEEYKEVIKRKYNIATDSANEADFVELEQKTTINF